MKKRSWWKLGLVVLVVVAAGAGIGFKIKSGEDASLDKALLAKVTKKDLAVEVIDTGKISPREKVDIKSKVAGQVLEVLVEEGQRVDKGQLLLKLDPVDYARDAARAEAELAQAQQALQFAELALSRKKAGAADRAVAAADVEVAQNEADMRRSAVKIAEVALSAARDRVSFCQIKAPIAGTVIARGIEPGEVVTPGVQATFDGKALLTIADLSTLLAKVELNQIDVARVSIGQKAKLTLDALPDKSFTATVTKIAPAAVKADGRDADVFPVETTLDNADGIKSGMTADVRILVETRPQVLVLPIEAIVKEDGKSKVKLVKHDGDKKTSDKVDIKTGKSNDRELEILEGLKEGDEVVIDPASSKDNEAKL